MAILKKGKYWYGDSQIDIQAELLRYSRKNEYPAEHYANAVCGICGGSSFKLLLDDEEGAAVRICKACKTEHPIGDSGEYLADADLKECECPCGSGEFEVTVGVALYPNSEDVRWLYVGCRCRLCGLTACYGDWKNEWIDFRELLNRV
ncbi:MAG TPA: hypothetical protein VF599_19820 [Pyrinomonadaceae bacterium]|jgi:hypothetical protein